MYFHMNIDMGTCSINEKKKRKIDFSSFIFKREKNCSSHEQGGQKTHTPVLEYEKKKKKNEIYNDMKIYTKPQF